MRLQEAEMQGEFDMEEFLGVSPQGWTELYPAESRCEWRHARKVGLYVGQTQLAHVE